MNPRPVTEADLAYWQNYDTQAIAITFQGGERVAECQAVSTNDNENCQTILRVPWELDEIELAHLVKGGTLWLSTWYGLPPHMLEVAPPKGAS